MCRPLITFVPSCVWVINFYGVSLIISSISSSIHFCISSVLFFTLLKHQNFSWIVSSETHLNINSLWPQFIRSIVLSIEQPTRTALPLLITTSFCSTLFVSETYPCSPFNLVFHFFHWRPLSVVFLFWKDAYSIPFQLGVGTLLLLSGLPPYHDYLIVHVLHDDGKLVVLLRVKFPKEKKNY